MLLMVGKKLEKQYVMQYIDMHKQIKNYGKLW